MRAGVIFFFTIYNSFIRHFPAACLTCFKVILKPVSKLNEAFDLNTSGKKASNLKKSYTVLLFIVGYTSTQKHSPETQY